MMRGAIKIFIPENNLGNEATHMDNMIKDRPDVRTYWQKEDRPGITKDGRSADNYQYLFDKKLEDDAILFHRNAFTTSRKRNFAKTKSMLREQLDAFHYEYDSERDKVKITGKGSGIQDDFAIAILQCVYHGRAATRDPRRLK